MVCTRLIDFDEALAFIGVLLEVPKVHELGLEVPKVHELGLEVPKVHELELEVPKGHESH